MTYDRARVMREAWRQWRYVKSKGWHIGAEPWTFSQCLRIAHNMERGRRLKIAA